MTQEPVSHDILIIEDHPADLRLAEIALKRAEAPVRISSAPDGAEGLAFLRREGRYATAPTPSLVLLDLRMPKKSGLEVLAEMKSDDRLRRIPIVVFTSSSADSDIAEAYQLHANCYVTKPIGLNSYIDTMRAIVDFWLRVVRLA